MTAPVEKPRIRVKAVSRPEFRLLSFERPPNSDVVGVLKIMLEKAEKGEIDGIAVAATRPDKGITTAYHYTSLFRLMGAVVAVDERLRSDVER